MPNNPERPPGYGGTRMPDPGYEPHRFDCKHVRMEELPPAVRLQSTAIAYEDQRDILPLYEVRVCEFCWGQLAVVLHRLRMEGYLEPR